MYAETLELASAWGTPPADLLAAAPRPACQKPGCRGPVTGRPRGRDGLGPELRIQMFDINTNERFVTEIEEVGCSLSFPGVSGLRIVSFVAS